MPKISKLDPAPILPLVGNEPFVVVQNGVTVKAPVDQIPINLSFPTIAALQAASPPAAEDSVYVEGYYASGDGGGHWRTRGTGAGEITDAAGYTWVVDESKYSSDIVFGSLANGIFDNITPLTNLFSFSESNNTSIYICGGNTYISEEFKPTSRDCLINVSPGYSPTSSPGVINFENIIPIIGGYPAISYSLIYKEVDSDLSNYRHIVGISSFLKNNNASIDASVAIYGNSEAAVSGARAFGANFGCYVTSPGAIGVACEIDSHVTTPGASSTALAIDAVGSNATNAAIVIQNNQSTATFDVGISFNTAFGGGVISPGGKAISMNAGITGHFLYCPAASFTLAEIDIPSLIVGPTPASKNGLIRIDSSSSGAPQISSVGSISDVGMHIVSKGLASVVIKSGDNISKIEVNSSGIGFYGSSPSIKPTITGSRGGNAALASLLTELATLGLITDGTTA